MGTATHPPTHPAHEARHETNRSGACKKKMCRPQELVVAVGNHLLVACSRGLVALGVGKHESRVESGGLHKVYSRRMLLIRLATKPCHDTDGPLYCTALLSQSLSRGVSPPEVVPFDAAPSSRTHTDSIPVTE